MGELRIMASKGDIKTIWDPKNEDETEAAEAQFDDLVEKGFQGYRVGKTGKKGRQIDSFDPKAGKIIMVPEMVGG